MDGFFSLSTLTEKPPPDLLPKCGKCKLFEGCQSPKMKVFGEGLKKILIIGQSPGAEEDRLNRPFIGKTGEKLKGVLAKFGVIMDRDCWLYNSLICRPPNNKIPNSKMVEWCRPNVTNTIQELDPEVVILLGAEAVESYLLSVWNDDQPNTIGRWVGWQIPLQPGNRWVCPTWHPSYLLREENPVLGKFFSQHIQAAVELAGTRPWKKIPEFHKQVECLFTPEQAVPRIQQFITNGKLLAFDFECDRLKPDAQDSTIVCCSISDGKQTIAYPWLTPMKEATVALLKSPVPKIASNKKYELRWAMARLGMWVNNFAFCTMIGAHVLDNRKGITSIKFQALVLLGQPSWNEHIKPFFEAKERGGNSKNRIKEVDMSELLTYCGVDSLLEYKVAQLQARQLGVEL